MLDPLIYNLVTNAFYCLFNCVASGLLFVAFSKTFDRLALIFLLSLGLSIFSSGLNLMISLIRILKITNDYVHFIRHAFLFITIIEPITIVLFYSGIALYSVHLLRMPMKLKNTDLGTKP